MVPCPGGASCAHASAADTRISALAHSTDRSLSLLLDMLRPSVPAPFHTAVKRPNVLSGKVRRVLQVEWFALAFGDGRDLRLDALLLQKLLHRLDPVVGEAKIVGISAPLVGV